MGKDDSPELHLPHMPSFPDAEHKNAAAPMSPSYNRNERQPVQSYHNTNTRLTVPSSAENPRTQQPLHAAPAPPSAPPTHVGVPQAAPTPPAPEGIRGLANSVQAFEPMFTLTDVYPFMNAMLRVPNNRRAEAEIVWRESIHHADLLATALREAKIDPQFMRHYRAAAILNDESRDLYIRLARQDNHFTVMLLAMLRRENPDIWFMYQPELARGGYEDAAYGRRHGNAARQVLDGAGDFNLDLGPLPDFDLGPLPGLELDSLPAMGSQASRPPIPDAWQGGHGGVYGGYGPAAARDMPQLREQYPPPIPDHGNPDLQESARQAPNPQKAGQGGFGDYEHEGYVPAAANGLSQLPSSSTPSSWMPLPTSLAYSTNPGSPGSRSRGVVYRSSSGSVTRETIVKVEYEGSSRRHFTTNTNANPFRPLYELSDAAITSHTGLLPDIRSIAVNFSGLVLTLMPPPTARRFFTEVAVIYDRALSGDYARAVDAAVRARRLLMENDQNDRGNLVLGFVDYLRAHPQMSQVVGEMERRAREE